MKKNVLTLVLSVFILIFTQFQVKPQVFHAIYAETVETIDDSIIETQLTGENLEGIRVILSPGMYYLQVYDKVMQRMNLRYKLPKNLGESTVGEFTKDETLLEMGFTYYASIFAKETLSDNNKCLVWIARSEDLPGVMYFYLEYKKGCYLSLLTEQIDP